MLLTPRVGLGTLRLSGEEPAVAVIHAALDAGIRVFDTARAYGNSEAILGKALATHSAGSRAFIMTKGGMTRPDGAWQPDGRAGSLRHDCEASLQALGRPIDLYLVHAPDPRVKWATTIRALARLQGEGLVREVGICNVNRSQLDEALGLAPIAAVQVAFSLLDDLPLRSGVLSRAGEKGITLIAHSPLGGPRRAKQLLASPLILELAKRHDVAPAAIALAALLQAHSHVVAIPGARTAAAALETAAAAHVELDDSERARLAAEFPSVCERVVVPFARERGEIVMIMGLPGSGKSALARTYVDTGFERLNRDELGGKLSAIAARADERLAHGATKLILDNTYLSRSSRAEVLAVAAKRGAAVRGVFIETAPREAQRNIILRMLERHGRLLDPEELRRGRDNSAISPTSFWRMLRTLELPAVDEGFSQLDVLPFTRVSEAFAERGARFVALELADMLPADELRQAFVIGWAPGAPADLEAQLSKRSADVLLCRHPGGPPICWCRPPLAGLLLSLAYKHSVDLARSELLGASTAHRDLATAVGMRFISGLS